MAEADYDCRPPGVRPTASGSESSNRFCGFSHPTFFYGSSILASACSLARRWGTGIQRPRFSPDGDRATRPHRRRVPHQRKKMQCSKPSLSVDLHQALGTYVEQLDFTVVSPPRCCFAEPRAQSQPCKVLISCLRVV